jgi:curved DNA-binding protein CbpA
MIMMNHYAVLELNNYATKTEIKRSYQRLILEWHPDKNDNSQFSNQTFIEIQESYEFLSDEGRKRRHDAFIASSANSNNELSRIITARKNAKELQQQEKEKKRLLALVKQARAESIIELRNYLESKEVLTTELPQG